MMRWLVPRLAAFGLCFAAATLPIGGVSFGSIVSEASMSQAIASGVLLIKTGNLQEPFWFVAAVLALAMSRPLFVSRAASLAHVGGMAAAFWLFPWLEGAFVPVYLVPSVYVEFACAAMLLGGLVGEYLLEHKKWRPERTPDATACR